MNTKEEGKAECWGDDQEISQPKRAQSNRQVNKQTRQKTKNKKN